MRCHGFRARYAPFLDGDVVRVFANCFVLAVRKVSTEQRLRRRVKGSPELTMGDGVEGTEGVEDNVSSSVRCSVRRRERCARDVA